MRGWGVVERVEARVMRLRVVGWLAGVREEGVKMRRRRRWGRSWGGCGCGGGAGRGRARSWVWRGVSEGEG